MIPLFCVLICFGCDFRNKELIKGYSIASIDEDAANSIYYNDNGFDVGVVNPTVFAVGYDSKYIIVKQHPREFPNPPNKLITYYYIIPLVNKVHLAPDKNKIGPLSLHEFELKKAELGVSRELDFTILYKNLD